MKKFFVLVLILVSLSLSGVGQELLFDGTADYKTAIIKPEVTAIFEKQVFPVAKKHFANSADCDEAFEINDGAAIYVAPNISEKVYLYSYCGDPFTSSFQGVAVIKNGQVTRHWVFNTFILHFDNIFYKNGLIVLSGTGTKMQSDWGIVTTLDIAAPGEQNSFWSYHNDCNDAGERCVLTAQKIYAEFNDGYWYFTESYKKQNGKWVKTKARKEVIETDEQLKEVLENFEQLK